MYVLLGVAAVASLVGFMLWRQHRAYKKARQAPILAWITSVQEAVTDEELLALPKPKHWWRAGELDEAKSKWGAAALRAKEAKEQREREAFQAKLREQFDALWEVPPAKRCAELATFPWYRLESRAEPRQKAREFFETYTATLYQEAQDGNAQSFAELFKLVRLDHPRGLTIHYGATGLEYKFPDEWDEVLVRFVKMPLARDFHNQPAASCAMVQIVAPRALADNEANSIVLAKWVLAVTRGNDDHSRSMRRAVGETLHGELLRYVHRYNASMRRMVL